jgi:flagellar export protein FliJ
MTKKTIKRVLDVKEKLREVRRSELADAARQVESAEQRASNARRERARAITGVTAIGEISARDLASRSALVEMASRDEQGAQAALDTCVEKRGQCSAVLREADREVRMFDVLQQRLNSYDRRNELAREQRDCDEAALRTRSTK